MGVVELLDDELRCSTRSFSTRPCSTPACAMCAPD